jgi:hypothetical protein
MVHPSKSASEERKRLIERQIDNAKLRLATKPRERYATEKIYRYQRRRALELIQELESELSILKCPGEYDELPVAIAADELCLTYSQIKDLIKLGEIKVTGKAAHERISREELERIALLGAEELLRLASQSSAEIFEQAIPHLHNGEIEVAERAFMRLDARESWGGPYAPAFLVGLELAAGKLEGALYSMKLIREYEDPPQRTLIMTYLRHVLIGLRLKDAGAQSLCDQLIVICERSVLRRPHRPNT